MLDIGKEAQNTPKCYFSMTTLPAYLDTKQQPTKKKPFSTLHSQAYYHNISLLSPSSNPLKTNFETPTSYAKFKAPLKNLLQGHFFNKNIKTGNVILLSGKTVLENTSSSLQIRLVDGILRIDTDKATYERAGLQGSAIPNPHRRKHISSLYRVEINLRLPSMVAGKKGFERLKRAAEIVFIGEMTWLFCNLQERDATVHLGDGVEVERKEVQVVEKELEKVLTPAFPSQILQKDEQIAVELLEWLTLASISSPRLLEADDVDMLLSRYSAPENSTAQDLKLREYRGFMSKGFVADVFANAVLGSKDSWFGLLVQGWERRFVLLKTEEGNVLVWEIEG